MISIRDFTYIISLLLSAGLFFTVIFRAPSSSIKRNISVFISSVILWILSNFLADKSTFLPHALFWTQSAIIPAAVIPISFYFLSKKIPDERKTSWKQRILFVFPIFFLATAYTKLNVVSVQLKSFGVDFIPGPAYYLFLGYFLVFMTGSSISMWRRRRMATKKGGEQARLLVIGFLISASFSLITNVVLPLVGVPEYSSLGSIGSIVLVVFLTYISVRHHLLDLELIATELLSAALSILLLSRLLFSQGKNEYAINAVVFVLGVLLSFLLIRSSRREIARRQEVQRANVSLEALSDITRRITQSLDFSEVTQELVNAVANRLGYVGALVLVLDEDQRTVRATTISRTPAVDLILKLLPVPMSQLTGNLSDNNLVHQTIITGKINEGTDLADFLSPAINPVLAHSLAKAINMTSIITVPITSEGRVLGALLFALNKPLVEVSAREKETMKALGDELGIITRNIRIIEDLRRLDQAKSDFISIASHQLRTPISATKGYISMILDGDFGKVPEEIRDPLSKVYQANDRLVGLINDLLDISRIEGGRMVYQFAPTDLRKIIEDTVEILNPQVEKKKLKLSVEIPKSLPLIWADEEKVHELIKNITDNSVKYTNEGSIEIQAKVKKKERTILYSVKDTGIGISPNDLPKLFQKFTRGTAVSVVHTEGTGLGLYVARKIAEAHHARVWAESKGEGKGAQIYLEIPFITESDTAPKLSLSQPSAN